MNEDGAPAGVTTKGLPLPVSLPSSLLRQSGMEALNLRVCVGFPAFGTDTGVARAPADNDRETASGKPIGRPGT